MMDKASNAAQSAKESVQEVANFNLMVKINILYELDL
jgi:hypothetical protein